MAYAFSRGKRPFVLLIVFVGLLTEVLNSPVYAQLGGAANIAGIVTDESGGVLPGVTVTVTNTATGRAETLVTNSEGRYRAVALQPGQYEVGAQLQGFTTVRREATLAVGANATLDITLSVGPLAESITVAGESPLVEVGQSQPSSVITGDQLANMPVLSRNVMVLAQLLPGAAPINRIESVRVVQGATKFGAVPDQRYAYSTLIDGGDVDDSIWGHPTINVSQDAVAEFKVYRNQFDAQYGKATSALISIVTKAGTNRVSGSGYYFGRDRALNATNAFATDQPPFKQTRLGGSAGGPIVQNRTHYFASIEGLLVNSAAIVALPANNPFAAQENGTYPNKTRNFNYTARIDHRINNVHNMYVRLASDFQGVYATDKPVRLLDCGGVPGCAQGGNPAIDDFSGSNSVVVEENWTVSPTMVNSVRAHVLFHRLWVVRAFTGYGVTRPSFSWGQGNSQEFPRTRPSFYDTLLITRGKHDLNLGGEFTTGHYAWEASSNTGGTWTFQTDAPFDLNNSSTWPFQFTQALEGFYTHDASQITAYISDTYRVHPRWTLNLGLRWDFDTNLRDNAVYDRLLDDPQFKGLENFVHRGRDRGNQYDAFQPRLGATWNIRGDGTLVGRGGWGRYITRNRQWFSVSSQNQTYGKTVIFTDRAFLAQCYPSLSCLYGGKTLAEFPRGSSSAVTLIYDNYKFPEQRTATIGIGWQVTPMLSLDVDVVHSHVPNGLGALDMNLPPSGPISASNPRPVPTLGRVSIQNHPISKSWYDAVEMQVRQRVRGGNSLQFSYTLSRALLDGIMSESGLLGTQRTPQQFGYNPTDTRHNLAVSGSFVLPWDFRLSAIGRVISGSPLAVSCGCDLDGDGITTSDRPRGLRPTVGRGDLKGQLEIINQDRASRGLQPFTVDRLKVLPPANQIDVRLTKVVSLGPTRDMEVFLEAFNVTNFVNLTGGNGNYRLETFNIPTGAQAARQVQWGARYSF